MRMYVSLTVDSARPPSEVKMMYLGTGEDIKKKKSVIANLNPMMERLINQENHSLI